MLAVIRLYNYQYCEKWGRNSRGPKKGHFTFFQSACESEKLKDYYLSYQNKSPKT